MRRRSKVRSLGAVNYWPGYVDALTNVVLNLLFLIAMFGIALAVLNSRTVQRDVAAEGSGTGQQGQLQVVGLPERIKVTAPLTAEELTVGRDRGQTGAAARPAAVATAAGVAIRQATPGSGLVAQRIAVNGQTPGPGGRGRDAALTRGAGQQAGAAAGRPDGSPRQVPTGGGTPAGAAPPREGPGQLGDGYPFAGIPQERLSFSVVDAYQRRLMPGVRIEPRPAAGNGLLLTVALARGTEPLAALAQPGFRSALQASLGQTASWTPARGGKVRVWTATRLDDPVLRRTAYLALIAARNQLLSLGYPSAAIEVRLIEGSASKGPDKLIYLLATPANSN